MINKYCAKKKKSLTSTYPVSDTVLRMKNPAGKEKKKERKQTTIPALLEMIYERELLTKKMHNMRVAI